MSKVANPGTWRHRSNTIRISRIGNGLCKEAPAVSRRGYNRTIRSPHARLRKNKSRTESQEQRAMEMKRLTGGSLRAAGYEARNQKLVVGLTARTFEYSCLTSEGCRTFSGAS